VSILTTIPLLIPSAFLIAAWRRYFHGTGDPAIPRWRSYSGGGALVLASLATASALVFFIFWLHRSGPDGRLPLVLNFVGRIGIWAFLASMPLSILGKGRWRLFILAWVISMWLAVALIFGLELTSSKFW
jgi:hypothetical protein